VPGVGKIWEKKTAKGLREHQMGFAIIVSSSTSLTYMRESLRRIKIMETKKPLKWLHNEWTGDARHDDKPEATIEALRAIAEQLALIVEQLKEFNTKVEG